MPNKSMPGVFEAKLFLWCFVREYQAKKIALLCHTMCQVIAMGESSSAELYIMFTDFHETDHREVVRPFFLFCHSGI